jgi:hypothetical protein
MDEKKAPVNMPEPQQQHESINNSLNGKVLTKLSPNFEKYQIDLSKDYKEPKPLICIGERPIFTRGNISCISGKAKSRKTFLIGLLISQFLEADFNAKILIFDTEQAFFHVQKSVKRIHSLVGFETTENKPNLKVFALRELSTDERRMFVVEAINHFKTDLVFIDGVRDILKDFNDIRESSEIVNQLMKISSVKDCHICCIMHENKGDNNVRGHAGTELQNKSETVISVTLDGNVTKVEPKYCRNIPFETFHFRINEQGLPEYCEPDVKPKKTDAMERLFGDLLPANVTLSFTDLREKVVYKTARSQRTAERYIREATTNSIICQNNANQYYSVSNNTFKDEDELPF